MAGVKRVINTWMWHDPFTRSLNAEEKLVFIYFLSNMHTTLCGVYELPPQLALYETGVSKESVESFLVKANSAKKLHYNQELGAVFIRNYIKYQTGGRPAFLANARKQLNELSFPIHEWLEEIGAFDTLFEDSGKEEFTNMNSDVKELLEFFGACWHNKMGKPFPINWEKGNLQVRDMLKSYKKPEIVEYIKLFFASSDKFAVEGGYTLPIFTHMLPKFIINKERGDKDGANKEFVESKRAEIAELVRPKSKTRDSKMPAV